MGQCALVQSGGNVSTRVPFLFRLAQLGYLDRCSKGMYLETFLPNGSYKSVISPKSNLSNCQTLPDTEGD